MLDVGATLLGNISGQADLHNAMEMIQGESGEQEEKALILVNYLCLVETFQQ